MSDGAVADSPAARTPDTEDITDIKNKGSSTSHPLRKDSLDI